MLDLVSRLPLRIIKSNAFGDWLLFTVRQPLPEFVNGQTQADDGESPAAAVRGPTD